MSLKWKKYEIQTIIREKNWRSGSIIVICRGYHTHSHSLFSKSKQNRIWSSEECMLSLRMVALILMSRISKEAKANTRFSWRCFAYIATVTTAASINKNDSSKQNFVYIERAAATLSYAHKHMRIWITHNLKEISFTLTEHVSDRMEFVFRFFFSRSVSRLCSSNSDHSIMLMQLQLNDK